MALLESFGLHRFKRLFLFLLVGLPAFVIAVPLNWVLVEKAAIPKPAAYALVLVIQVTINFFLCVRFVFRRDESISLIRQFLVFVSGILTARALDWALYSLLVTITQIHYIAIQAFNVVIFSALKFLFARRAIEGSDSNRRIIPGRTQ